ncbi:MAG: NAD(P)H-hydrate dehydratase [Nitratireductor sp.]
MNELLTPQEMARADALAIHCGITGIELMENAGRAVFDVASHLVVPGRNVMVLCGTGNNGGDGFIAARLLHESGFKVIAAIAGNEASIKGDAAIAFRRMRESGVVPVDADEVEPERAALIIDALLGAGIDRPVTGRLAALISRVNGSGVRIVAVDLPSGINGANGAVMGIAVQAHHTVTFFRRKPGHLLYPGRHYCGEITLAQIGIPASVLSGLAPKVFANDRRIWGKSFPLPQAMGHKYDRGHALVLSGPQYRTGAARLAAQAALRIGAGLVTLASPVCAMAENAAHLTEIMLREMSNDESLRALLSDQRFRAALAGPGGGADASMRGKVAVMLEAGRSAVLDADALTAFAEEPETLFGLIAASEGDVVMTPHAGEFARLFGNQGSDRLAAAREAAARSSATIILKGGDTVIAAPDGRTTINENAPPWLATAGSGDVLAGLACGLLAQGMTGFEAACCAVWIHGAAAAEFGPGLIAGDIEKGVPAVMQALLPVITQL